MPIFRASTSSAACAGVAQRRTAAMPKSATRLAPGGRRDILVVVTSSASSLSVWLNMAFLSWKGWRRPEQQRPGQARSPAGTGKEAQRPGASVVRERQWRQRVSATRQWGVGVGVQLVKVSPNEPGSMKKLPVVAVTWVNVLFDT